MSAGRLSPGAAALLLLLPLFPALASALWHPRRPAWDALLRAAPPATSATELDGLRLELAQVRASHVGALWIDARPPGDHAAAHVPGAISLHEGAWDEGFAVLSDRWDGVASIVVYCGGENCRASEAVALRLRRELGFERVFVLGGGWDAWLAATRGEEAR